MTDIVKPADIESRYRDILHQQMEGVALVNQRLDVAAIGFRELLNDSVNRADGVSFDDAEQIGVLLTPWFMNLMLLPGSSEQWTEQLAGTKTTRRLPSGRYEFIYGWDPVLGGYGMCALFSPMFEFDSQQQAVATADEVLHALFDQHNYAPTDRQIALQEAAAAQEQSLNDRSGMAMGKDKESDFVVSASPVSVVTDEAQQGVERPAQLSRRQFFTAGLSTDRRKG
ncbi:[NiFe]-hydrogenase assembly chaperone HybE [Amphritea sp. HPY]|uniref:[NiFe]-hydrogenase assembly chaperone HybE n=1 Tax=Amphritea sp. HPY TaxID=3421652 RepID=UPI003D7D32E6